MQANASSSQRPPLLKLRGVTREYPGGDGPIAVLKEVDLDIHAGEMLAIIGPSGSGKSTLMNILGCLDAATRGSVQVSGRETSDLTPDELSELRREHFGFVFQRYQLLTGMTALENVELPALYAGVPRRERVSRAQALLDRLGLGERITHKPGQLSGGQQQRVSIARALMNGGEVILADEPTGALDSASGAEVMRLLKELNAAGHTIILVTHDHAVAAHANRVVEIADGRIVADRQNPSEAATAPEAQGSVLLAKPSGGGGDFWGSWREAIATAMQALTTHKLRSGLTMLGIVIGVLAVILVNAIGAGVKAKTQAQLSDFSVATVQIFGGGGRGADPDKARPLTAEDVKALAKLPGVAHASPEIPSNGILRVGRVARNVQILGVSESYFAIKSYAVLAGSGFSAASIEANALEAVIDRETSAALFETGQDPIGQTMLLGRTSVRVVGVIEMPQSSRRGRELNVWLPYSTVMTRLAGSQQVPQIVLRVKDDADSKRVEKEAVDLLTLRHGQEDFAIWNVDASRKRIMAVENTQAIFTTSIAVIALVVGGIGVMNIMLVTVSERTREIGTRMAVGARQKDILRQFLVEAAVVCFVGATIGIGLALLVGLVVSLIPGASEMIFTPASIVIAGACASAIGLVFGFFPALGAARLNPAAALSRD